MIDNLLHYNLPSFCSYISYFGFSKLGLEYITRVQKMGWRARRLIKGKMYLSSGELLLFFFKKNQLNPYCNDSFSWGIGYYYYKVLLRKKRGKPHCKGIISFWSKKTTKKEPFRGGICMLFLTLPLVCHLQVRCPPIWSNPLPCCSHAQNPVF